MKSLQTFKKISYFSLLLVLTLLLHSKYVLDVDEGVLLAGAWNLWNGRVIYLDFFEFVPPGAFYAVLFAWKIFGPDYLTAKILSIAVLYLSTLGVYKIARQIPGNRFASLPPVLFLLSTYSWPIVHYHTFSLLASVWLVYWLLKANKKNTMSMMCLGGLISALGLVMLQNKGLLLILAVFALWLVRGLRRRSFFDIRYSPVYLSVSLALPGLLLLKWPFPVLFEHLVSFPLTHYLPAAFITLDKLLVFAALLSTAWLLLHKRRDERISRLIYMQAVLLAGAFSNADHLHITLAVFPLYALLGPMLQELNKLKLYWRVPSALLLLVSAWLVYAPNIFYARDFSPFYSIRGNPAFEFIKQECSETDYIYSGPFYPNIYFETRLLPAGRHTYLIRGHNTEEHFNSMKQSLEELRPECVVYNFYSVEKYNYDPDNPVDNYIEKHYTLYRKFPSMEILKLKK